MPLSAIRFVIDCLRAKLKLRTLLGTKEVETNNGLQNK
jgi:hypothetical protein